MHPKHALVNCRSADTKIFAQWRVIWWDVSVYKWAQANPGFNGGELGSVRNLAHESVLPGSRTLLFDLGDPQSSEWEALSDESATARLLASLRAMHPNVTIPAPIAFHMTRHSRDALSYGAYSAWGTSDAVDHARAARPLAARVTCTPRVWLSGEALCPNYNGFVHGGILAGRRDARKVLAALGRPLPPSSHEEDAMGCNAPSTRLAGQAA